jgi:site-specific DNA-methyltransferase (adenine-specific)
VLPQFVAGTFDCCIADPNYGDTSLDWDKVCDGWIEAVAATLKPAASIWVFGSMRTFPVIFAQMKACGFRYSQDIVWEKQNGTGFLNDRFRRVHEHAVLFYRGAWSDVYHDTQFTMDAKAKVVRAKKRPVHMGYIEKTPYISHEGGPRIMRSVLQIRNEHGRAVHPTQKPVDLIMPMIRYSCPKGGHVIDPFGGSGSTAIAARISGRSCTCIELDPDRAAIARNRIEQPAQIALA